VPAACCGSLRTGCTSLSDRRVSVQDTQSSVQLVQAIKRSEREASHRQRPVPKMKVEPAVTAVTVRIGVVVSDSCAQ